MSYSENYTNLHYIKRCTGNMFSINSGLYKLFRQAKSDSSLTSAGYSIEGLKNLFLVRNLRALLFPVSDPPTRLLLSLYTAVCRVPGVSLTQTQHIFPASTKYHMWILFSLVAATLIAWTNFVEFLTISVIYQCKSLVP